MADADEQAGAATTTQAQASESQPRAQTSGPTTQSQPSEEEMRAAYEAELNRITSSEMIIQTAVSLINIGGRRLGLTPSASPGDSSAASGGERDLEQVRDAIDGASALLPVLERRMPGELGPLRDAIAQLQVAYAREARGSAGTKDSGGTTSTTSTGTPGPRTEQAKPSDDSEKPAEDDGQQGPGPAQASGRLWVPGR
jgi:hypothetical protein